MHYLFSIGTIAYYPVTRIEKSPVVSVVKLFDLFLCHHSLFYL